jgi:hypothetical protein
VVPFGDVVGTWMVIGDLTFPTVVTFTAANGQFANGEFTWEVTNTLTGQVTTVQGTYTVGLVPESGLISLTMVSQGEIRFWGIYAQPGPGEFTIETFAAQSMQFSSSSIGTGSRPANLSSEQGPLVRRPATRIPVRFAVLETVSEEDDEEAASPLE